MDGNLEEITETTLPPVVTPFCLSWTDDCTISVVTTRGLVIFEYKPDPGAVDLKLRLTRSQVEASKLTPVRSTSVTNNHNEVLWMCKQEELYEMFMDNCYASYVRDSQINYNIVQCQLSSCVYSRNRCLAAVLTNLGAVHVYVKKNHSWEIHYDISEEWNKHCSQKNTNLTETFSSLKLAVDELRMTAICWSKKIINKEQILFTTLQNGGLTVWLVSESENVKLLFNHVFDIFKPFCLEVHYLQYLSRYLVLIGALNGNCKAVLLEESNKQFKVLQEFGILCEQDEIKVNKILVFEEESSVLLFICKRHILYSVILEVHVNKFKIKQKQLLQFQTEITSLIKNNNNFIVYLSNSKSYILSVDTSFGKDFISTSVLANNLKPQGMYSTYSVVCSYNKALWCFVHVPKYIYDIKSTIETAKLTFYWSNTKFKTTEELNRFMLKTIDDNKYNDMTMLFDLLDVKRIYMNKCLVEIERIESTDNLSMNELKLLCWEWLFLYRQSHENKFVLQVLDKFKQEILKLFYTKRLENMQDKQSSTSVQRMKIFLGLAKEEGTDVCVCCGAKLVESNYEWEICVNSHKLPRCRTSLETCLPPYATCALCQSLSLLKHVTEVNYICPLCDGVLIPDDRFS